MNDAHIDTKPQGPHSLRGQAEQAWGIHMEELRLENLRLRHQIGLDPDEPLPQAPDQGWVHYTHDLQHERDCAISERDQLKEAIASALTSLATGPRKCDGSSCRLRYRGRGRSDRAGV